MKCDLCDKEAVVHLTQVVNGEVKEVHLCEEHAISQGIDINSPVSITDILMGLSENKRNIESQINLSCPSCGILRDEFRKNGRLGCPDCYNTFMAELSAAIRAMHHASQHVGKIPGREGTQARAKSKIARLQNDLKTAVARENFEKAAQLRDEINTVREQLKGADQ